MHACGVSKSGRRKMSSLEDCEIETIPAALLRIAYYPYVISATTLREVARIASCS
jgi:hypothetical protein